MLNMSKMKLLILSLMVIKPTCSAKFYPGKYLLLISGIINFIFVKKSNSYFYTLLDMVQIGDNTKMYKERMSYKGK